MASPIFLRSLPRAIVKPSMLGKLKESSCSICLEEFLAGEQVTLLPCTHLYHTDCIITALKANHTCPLCRHEFPRVLETQPVPEEPQRTRRRRHNRELFMMWFSHEGSTPGGVDFGTNACHMKAHLNNGARQIGILFSCRSK